MAEYLDDPSVLTKDKLKNELVANNVELPGGNPTKDVYVQLYLKNLTVQNKKNATASLDAFSSDEELTPPVVSNRSRSSGRKATRKTDKAQPEDLDVTELTAEGLKDELLKYGVDTGPIVASTRKLYEKKLQKLLDQGPPQAPEPRVVLTETDVNHNGNPDSDRYSDKEEEETPVQQLEPVPDPDPEPELKPVPEPVSESIPVVERPVRSRGKTPVTTRTRSSQHNKVEKITASEPTHKAEERDVLKEMFPNDFNSPTGIGVTCRRPIRGAAGRPFKSSEFWNDENFLRSPKSINTTTTTSSYTESRAVHRVSNMPPSTPSSPRLVSAAPPMGQSKATRSSLPLWLKLILLAVVASFLFFIYQAMETNAVNPFMGSDMDQSVGDSGSEVTSK
ncbi:thymopoietin a [Lampris incognitus]|uniref:thymopoietin a n=1 Tax=Lampris incognitus TaxID=2546036 RepID=UPI0024B52339|nr:thymopoietin a [Lampris incognitus]XP_056133818.1 thymopoietin a [Lampris incognitus]XP_056133819.1 thymopoietin a [Lampris incognitus]